MQEETDKQLTDAQKKAAAFLTRQGVRFAPAWYAAREAEEEKRKAEETARKEKEMAAAVAWAKAGDVMPDGTVYLGLYKGKDWFVTAGGAKDGDGKNLTMDFNSAAAYAQNLKAHGHDDWIVPPHGGASKEPDILLEMFNNKSKGAFKDTYDEGDSLDSGIYWSSSLASGDPGYARVQGFGDTYQHWTHHKDDTERVSLRCVRAVPHP